eukprot:TRINITY_DN19178_c0_g1_i1.p1 TRINITY_DN19178_c0_g1~~TRINITY_DN19178_c0_g1_i1.p1  ORF type:complete len:267 (-),score=41.04 TRINITY_DN19178_c0_g1_i1:227-976(-)
MASAAATALAEAAKARPEVASEGPGASFTLPHGASGPPRCGVVWMHGLGDTEAGWFENLKGALEIPASIGPCKFILPRSPTQAVSINSGQKMTSWFDMKVLPLEAPSRSCCLDEALASCHRVHRAVESLEQDGIPPERILIGGFSQGGAMSMLSTFTYPKRLAGTVVFSGVLFFREELQRLMESHCSGMEVFWGHGTQDNVLDISLQAEGIKVLEDAGLKVQSQQYEMGHSAHPKELADMTAFIARLLG